ncbi:ABC transporter ATP-binding protein [Clostridium sp. D2Q-14]|uniref:ABC transporter ATP-binding protein n=1 Tax=Anaeromonas gelatinilytica TaxID=2683194 RepID=UPI00193B5FB7|nr:ABC transporter ATP-binding protein [Anaeromonas gelatinilytica]MBS4534316.1 ABC transporter ATP-binding protein [Anaeromonas gelatinilytica]
MNSCQKNKVLIKGVSKSFENLLIVDDISIELREKEFVTILGPSGSGKSTLFNIISGLIKPDSGKVYIEGEDFTGKTGRVSYMYQKDLLLSWKKIIDNVSMPLIIKGERKEDAREKVKKYFEIFGLEGFEYKYPHQLSGGMKQRAALMRTYMFSKDIILLDEPFGGLDAITKSKMQSWLLDILDRLEASILFITHDIEEAIFLSDRIYILSDRPARIKEEIKIDISKPRNSDVITTNKFNNIKRHILDLL